MTDLTRARWRKSTHSGDNGGARVEVADNLRGVVALRDSKDPTGLTLTFRSSSWAAFVAAARYGTFGHRC